MKAFGALIFVALAAVAAAGPALIPNHPICVPINNDYYHSFPDPDDCTCFYKCDWSNAVRFCCPKDNESDGNLVFNPTLQVCDRKDVAIAGGAVCSGIVVPSTEPATNPPTCHPPTGPAVTDPPPTGPAVTSPPPTGPAVTNPPPTGPAVTNPPATEPPAPVDGCAHRVAECPSQNEFYHSYPHATCDNRWCQCDWGKAIEQPCARDHAPQNYLVFDGDKQVCDYQKNGVSYNLCNY